MTYITVTEVRNRSGVPSSLMTDTQIEGFISQVEAEMARWLNTSFIPKQEIEIRDGNNLIYMFARKNPILSVRQLTINESTAVTPSTIKYNKSSGKIMLTNASEGGIFVQGSQNTFINYLHGMLEKSSTSTNTTVDVAAATDVELTVSSITDFTSGDWVEIYGMDGKREVAEINDTPVGTTIQVDQLIKAHESGSFVTKLQIPEYIKVYMLIEASIAVAINAIGSTYVFNASYSLGELSVTKGVPYTHWRESVEKLLKERAMRKSRIKPRPSIMVD